MAELKPRIARGINSRPDFILFTDAAASATLIAGVLFRPRSTGVLQLTTGRAPSAWLSRFHRRNKIFGTALPAPLDFVRNRQKLVNNSTCAFYLESNNAIAALLRGDSFDSFVAEIVATFRRLAQQLGMAVWIGRVRSKLNVADLPTRSLPPL